MHVGECDFEHSGLATPSARPGNTILGGITELVSNVSRLV